MEARYAACFDGDCVCNGKGNLIWVVDYYRWRWQLLCNIGGLIYLEVESTIDVYDYVGDIPWLKGNPARDTPPTPSADDTIRCIRCNRLILKTGKHHKYCSECASIRRKHMKKEWIKLRRIAQKEGNIK